MRNDNAVILTDEQLKEAIIKGALILGYLPVQAGGISDVTIVSNGAVILLGEEVAPAAVQLQVTDFRTEAPPAPKLGPEPEVVKEALAKVMDRPPALSSIRAWDEKQRKQALAWAKKVTALPNGVSDAEVPKRPEFIKERAVRGSKATPAESVGAIEKALSDQPATPAANATRRGNRAAFETPDIE